MPRPAAGAGPGRGGHGGQVCCSCSKGSNPGGHRVIEADSRRPAGELGRQDYDGGDVGPSDRRPGQLDVSTLELPKNAPSWVSIGQGTKVFEVGRFPG